MNLIKKADRFLRPYYHHVRLFLWATFKFPGKLLVADTDAKMFIHNWPAAALLKTETTKVENGRMFYEPSEYPHFLKMVKGKKIFYDVGAFIGWYSLIAASCGSTNVVAFEIIPELAKLTQKNFALNALNGSIVCAPVGKGGEQSSYRSNLVASSGKAISLDEYAEAHNLWPDAIKMDIEGAEYDALLGAHRVLSRKPVLDISVHPEFLQERGHGAQEVLDMLAGYGYKIVWSGENTYFME